MFTFYMCWQIHRHEIEKLSGKQFSVEQFHVQEVINTENKINENVCMYVYICNWVSGGLSLGFSRPLESPEEDHW